MKNRIRLRTHRLTALAVVVLVSYATTTLAATDNIEPLRRVTFDEVGAGELLFKTGEAGNFEPALQLSTEVDMSISGLVAEVTVSQSFKNPTSDWAEGVYVFPLPDTAAVNAMKIQIGDRTIVGEIKEKQQARQVYHEAKQSGKKAALVEQRRPNMFATAVANIGPGQVIVVTLTYLQKVHYDRGLFSLRFPMTITPRYIPGVSNGADEQPMQVDIGSGWGTDTDQVPDATEITPFLNARVPTSTHLINPMQLAINLDPGLSLAEVTSTYHDIRIVRKNKAYEIAFADTMVSMDRDFELTWRPVRSDLPQAALFTEEYDKQTYALLMVLPPHQVTASTPLPRETVFVIDTSGSMGGEPIRQATAALQLAIDMLGPNDRFNIIAFSNSHRKLFRQSRRATSADLNEARRFVAGLDAGGGTEMASAIAAALPPDAETPEGYLRQVVFITDGAVGNEEQLFRLIEERLGDSRLFTVGIGAAPNSYFMRKAAQFGRGSFTYIGNQSQVQEKMGALFTRLAHPLLREINLTWSGGVAPETFPDVIPDLYLGQPLIITTRLDEVHGALKVSGKGPSGPWLRELKMDTARQHDGVAGLWARDKISKLNDAIAFDGENESMRADILQTALTHHLVSRYTSFVAVEQQPSRPASDRLKTSNVPNARPAGQSAQPFAYPATATTAIEKFWLGAMAFCLALLCLAWFNRITNLHVPEPGEV